MEIQSHTDKSHSHSHEGMEAVFLSFDTVIAGDINIPPSAAIIGTIPSVQVGSVLAVIAVKDIAGNVVTAADGGEKVGVIEADAFAGVEGAADIEILILGFKIVDILYKKCL